ncbi:MULTISPECIES: prolyl oligopeptidase family serine peptidase [unclassified Breznakia]|uniref:carboxylesterase family protein n=1 Tax=unclassified Breznakia TaxID=2623764 RepID=UPI0024772752|nr:MULTISPECIES: prolyl oligopeptidase family serine peptidase [unclassified Breznakia]MDH6367955.1 putative peptidase [Breznakia sp. PH1-1]MDH6405043.1 putative peptidase [Breznakia sp. PF1-11]MDH6412758.1 putative peptidase [Breznakia sp. PFB1-11]MDH6415105.1 putative peptidase [Breznakia sp. PFB1-14]MDH6417429.1 putative peptidase [Breznakia sp. PFB1-4]
MPELTLWDELTLTGEDQTEAVVDMIKEYIEQNPNIDTDRVYIGGGSMGGYQVWETLFAAPELFTAAFPICQAYEVPQDKLETVKDIPIWMAHTKTDATIPVSYSQDAYTNAKALGLNITYTEFESVEVDGVELETHAAWVYLLNNNATNEEGEQFFDWLAAQEKVDAIIDDDSSNNDTLFVGAIVGVTVLALAFSYLRSKKQN